MRYLLIIALFLCGASSVGQVCEYSISGTLNDLHDNTPLSGATIIVAGVEKAVLTNLDGYYKIDALCAGDYVLQISHPECSTKAFEVEVNENVVKNFSLEHHLEALNEVILKGQRYTTKSETVLENTVDTKIIERFSAANLGDALKTLSGVSALQTGNTIVKPIINGLHSSRIAVINNGVRMQDQEWGVEHAPNIDINSASFLTVIKGASALQYTGDAIGGVIISEPIRISLKDSLYGKSIFTYASNGRGGSNSTSIIKSYENGWYGQLQGTIKRFGDYEAPDYVLSNTGNFERNINLRVGFNQVSQGFEAQYSFFRNDIGILRASHLGGAEDQVRAINSEVPLIINDFTYNIGTPRQEVTHQTARLFGFKEWEHLGKVTVQYDFQKNDRFEFDIRRGDDANKPSVDLELITHNFLADIKTEFTPSFTLKNGLMLNYQENIANPETGVRRLIPDYEQYKAGIFSIADWQVSDKLLLEAGIRYDYTFLDAFKFYRTSFWESRNYDTLFADIVIEDVNNDWPNQTLTNPQLTFHNLSSTLGASFRFDENYTGFLNVSLASRAPNASELFSEGLHHSASRIELGDLRFEREQSQKIALTFQKQGNFSFTINPFYNRLDNFIIIEPTRVEQTLRGNFQVWEYRQTQAYMLGIDTDVSVNFWNHFTFSNAFSLVKGYERNNNTPIIDIPPVSFVNTLSYNPSKKWGLQLQQEYVFAQNEFPDTNFEVFIPTTESFELVDVSTPPPAYQLWSLLANYQFNITNKIKLDMGVQITNVFDTTYRNYLNRLRFYADDLGRNFLINTKINF